MQIRAECINLGRHRHKVETENRLLGQPDVLDRITGSRHVVIMVRAVTVDEPESMQNIKRKNLERFFDSEERKGGNLSWRMRD